MDKHHRFKLISPIVGDKIYQTNSFTAGAKKCFEELKGCGKNDANEFTIMNLNNFETYKFGIDKREKHVHGLQHGGQQEMLPIENISGLVGAENVMVEQNIDKNKISRLEKAVVFLNDKINLLEERVEKMNKIIQMYKNDYPEQNVHKIKVSEAHLPETAGQSLRNEGTKDKQSPQKNIHGYDSNKLNRAQKSDVEDF